MEFVQDMFFLFESSSYIKREIRILSGSRLNFGRSIKKLPNTPKLLTLCKKIQKILKKRLKTFVMMKNL